MSSQVFFEGDRGAWRAAIERRVFDFVENEYPEMNRIILDSLEKIEKELGSQPAPTGGT